MHRFAALVVSSIAFAGAARAQEVAPVRSGAIAVIDLNAALREHPRRAEHRAALDTMRDDLRAQVDADGRLLRVDGHRLEVDTVDGQEGWLRERDDLRRRVQEAEERADRAVTSWRRAVAEREAELLADVRAAVDDLARREHLALVLRRAPPCADLMGVGGEPEPEVLFVAPHLDVTANVIALLLERR